MDELRSILATHNPRKRASEEKKLKKEPGHQPPIASIAEIPDIFFDEVLVNYKLSRNEILVLMYLYRRVYCRPNLYQDYGISPMFSTVDASKELNIDINEFLQITRKLESLGIIETIRSGQYFVRRHFTEELDEKYEFDYEQF